MRFDTPIFFQENTPGEYDRSSGNYGAVETTEIMRYASVTSAGTEANNGTVTLGYGELRQGSLVVRIQNHYDDTFDRIRIGKKLYRVDFSRRLRTKHVFVVSEVQ